MTRVLAQCAELGFPAARGAALDFGSGAGRLALPLANAFRSVAGVDISPAMRSLAARNAADQGLDNVSFFDSLEATAGLFDFAHSLMVFQHMPVADGLAAIRGIADRLAPNGVAALQAPLDDRRPGSIRALMKLRRFTPINILVNILRGRAAAEPLMRMYVYDMNRIALTLLAASIDKIGLLVCDDMKFPHCYVVFRKSPSAGFVDIAN